MTRSNHRSGLSMMELIVAAAALSVLMLMVGRTVIELRRTEKKSIDDLMSLSGQRIAGLAIRRDLVKSNPSFNFLRLAPSSGQNGSFFDSNPALGCNESFTSCERKFQLVPGGASFFLLTDYETEGLGVFYDPRTAFSNLASATYSNLNNNNVLTNSQAIPIPGGWQNAGLYLLTSIGNTVIVRPSNSGNDQCHCIPSGNRVDCAQASGPDTACSGAERIPFLTPVSYLGYASGIATNGHGGDLATLPTYTGSIMPTNLIPNSHPTLPDTSFGNNPKLFLTMLPSTGDLQSRAQIKRVRLIRYRLLANKTLERSEWQHVTAGGDPFDARKFVLATKVLRVEFKRASISFPQISFGITMESTL